MIIAQITDTHVSDPRSTLDRTLKTAQHLERAVAHLLALRPQPDLVVVTGDCVDGGAIEEYERFRGILKGLSMPVFLAVGNHDDRDHMRSVFADCAWLPRRGFIQYALNDWPVRMLILDTQIPGKPGGLLCADRLAWLRERLLEAPEKPTLILQHHPPFPSGIRFMDSMGLATSAQQGTVVSEFSNIERISAGHVHRPMQRRLFGTIAMTCPSTSHQLALDLSGSNRLAIIKEPPACLLHSWSEETGLVSHLSAIGEFGPAVEIYDGEQWIENPTLA